ncbi:metal ABC transporter permease [Schaalia suimastitidis]|uniref:metal ABC transporter permease n=1 Tax=Schaalia suimastitidis TaxID=121163 RepID=UPI0004181E55|nr:metal ABC transporter permease [Schaalia suimastitidis]
MIVDFLSQTVYQRVIVGTSVIGATCGFLGTFTYLRRQSLIADVVGHSSMLGVTSAYLLSVLLLGIDGRSIVPIIVICALVGVLSAFLTSTLSRFRRVGLDAAMAVVLALTFGGGMVIMAEIRLRPFPSSRAGLEDYLFGNATTLTWSDISLSAICAVIAVMLILVMWRDIALLVFDRSNAHVMGRPVSFIEMTLVGATVVGIVIGLKAVGLVLVVAYVILPPAAARQWTRHLGTMSCLSAFLGLVASLVGALLSVMLGKVPSGPLTVIVLTVFTLFSMVAAPRRSLIVRAIRRAEARRRLAGELQNRGPSQASTRHSADLSYAANACAVTERRA